MIRNGSQIDTVQGAVTEYSDVNVDPFTTYTYAIIAADAAGNPSPASVPIVVTTPAPPPVFTETPVADSYVDGNQLGQNFGLSQTLRVDTTPDRRTYVRFNVNGINAPVTSATLRIYTNSTHPLGFEVHELSDNGWQETTITHSNAPAFGPSLAFSGPTTAGQYREVDMTGYVTADGFYNFVLTGLNSTSLPMGSRESANQPELVITQNTSQPGVADSYVDANTPATNFGLAPTILVGTSPEQRGYLRFDVSGLTTPVTDATLRLYVDNAHPQGFQVQHVTNDVWGEQTINFNNAPGFGPVVGASGATTAGQYHDIDLTEHITGNGTYSLALTALGAPAISLGSRESANPPQLNVIEQGPNSAPIAHNQSVPTTTNTPVVITLTAIDLDGDCPLGFSIVGTGTGTLSPITNTQCSNGVASADVTYTPSPGTAGADAFTFEVTDPTPATSNLATVNVSITAGLPPIQPSDDATVRPGINSTTNYGSDPDLLVDASSVKDFLLRFGVAGVGATTVLNATLRLHATNSSPIGGIFTATTSTSTSWSESTVTFDSAPVPDGIVLGSLGPVALGNWYELDVTPLITGDGPVSIRVSSTSPNGADYASKENISGLAPELVITLDGPPVPDTEDPGAPPNLVATEVLSSSVTLDWDPSTDNVGVVGYDIVRNGVPLVSIGPATTFQDTTVSPVTGYTYEVIARDAAGNTSLPSTVAVTTPVTPSVFTLAVVDDATVRPGSNSTTNYGSDPDLLVDASSRKDFLLRFNVAGVGASTVLNATLRVHATDGSSVGGDFTATTDTGWSESTVTWDSAPVPNGIVLGSLGPVALGNWYELDVTPLITGDGPVSIRVSSTSPNGADYASKENISGLAPELVITLS